MEATISRLTCHDRVEPRLSIFLNVQFILFLEIFLPKKYLSSLYLSTLLPLRTIIISLCIQDDRTIRRAIDVSYRQFFFFFFFSINTIEAIRIVNTAADHVSRPQCTFLVAREIAKKKGI